MECQTIDPLTMATTNPDSEGFRLVLKPKTIEKAKMTPSSAPSVKPELEAKLWMIFQFPHQPHTDFDPLQHVTQLIVNMVKHDPIIAIHAMDADDILLSSIWCIPDKE